MAVTANDVQKAYLAYFGRPADPVGLAYWQASDAITMKAGFAASAEYASLYSGMNSTQRVQQVYQNLLGRAAETAGLNYWVGELDAGRETVSTLVDSVINNALNADAITVANRVTYATDFTAALDTQAEINGYSGDAASAAARTAVSAVLDTAASLTTAQGSLATTIVNIVTPASTFALTNSATADLIIGTAGNDTITGASGTVANGDMIIDQSTTDRDTANLTITAAYTPSKIANVENINIDWNAFGTATVDAGNISGASTITVSSSKLGYLGDVTVSKAGNQTVVAGTGAVGTLAVTDGKSVTVNGGASKVITVDGTATAADNLAATVTAGAATTTVTVGGTNAFKTTTVTGGAATTAVTVNGSAGSSDVANITVSKDATVTIATAVVETVNITAAAGNKVTLGGGSLLDKATITSTGAVTLVAAGADLTGHTLTNATTGLTIDFTSDAAADDLSKVQFSTLNMKNGLAANLTVASGAVVTAGVDISHATADLLTGTGTADTLTLNVSVDQTAALLSVIDGTNDVETLTINTALAAADADSILTIGQLDAVNAVLTGADKVTLTKFNATSVDASAVTKDFTATQDVAAATTVVGSATAKNTIVFKATTQDTAYTGGEGVDVVTMAQTTGNSTTILGNGANTYTNTNLTDGTAVVLGGTGVDTITVTATDSGANKANVVIQAGDGNDVVTLSLASANKETATLDLGAGDDKVTLANATSATDILSITGGDGTDTIDLNGKDISLGTITLTTVEVLNDSTGTSVVDASLLGGKTFTIKGNGNVATLLDVATGTAGSYDFSGLVLDQSLTAGIGGLSITGNAGNDTIVGTSGNDTIATNGGNDTITGGAGLDSITLGAGNDKVIIGSGHTGKTTATADQITAFKTGGTDTISFGLAATATNYLEAASTFDSANAGGDAVATIEQLIAQANTALDGTVRIAVLDNANANTGGVAIAATDSYVFFDRDGDGTADEVAKLVGKVLTDVAQADFVA